MAKVRVKKTLEIVLTLTEAEAAYIRDAMQNQIPGCDEEDFEDGWQETREPLFNTLKQALET